MRQRLDMALGPLLRRSIEHVADGLERAEAAAQQGAGTIIVWNHFSRRDGFDAGSLIAGSSVWYDRPSVFPVAMHQQSSVFSWLEKHAGYTYPYIATKNTKEAEGFENVRLNEGMLDFVKASQDTLKHGGTVSVAFQGGREEYLELDSSKTTIGTLVGSLRRGDVSNFGILLVGLGEKGRTDYSEENTSGLRLFRKKEIKIGPYFTIDELMEQSGNRLRGIDPFIRSQFVSLVPPEYLHPPTYESRKAQKRADLTKKAAVVGSVGAAVGLVFASKKKSIKS